MPTPDRTDRRLRAALLAPALLLVLAGCSSDDPVSSDASDAPVQETTTTEDPVALEAYAENEFAYGQEVSLRDGAVAPRELVALVGEDLVFHNESSAPQTVVFPHAGPDAAGAVRTVGPIAPGESATVHLDVGLLLSYHLESNPAVVGTIHSSPGTETL